MAQAQIATVGEFPAGSSLRYNLSNVINANIVGTQGVRESKRTNPLTIVPVYRTEPQEPTEGTETWSFRVQSSETPVSVEQGQINRSVDGVVDVYDEVSVQCRLRVENSLVSIQLPRPLFPHDIRHGLPIRLEMVDDHGIRKPLISVREIQPYDVDGIAEEFDAIIAAL